MGHYNKKIGSYGESLAESYLKNMGYQILEKNFMCYHKEIDIIAYLPKNNCICFIEVKSRFSNKYGTPSEAVTYKKIINLNSAAKFYISKNKLEKYNFRFDIIEIMFNNIDTNYNLQHIKNAF
ncbi:YraN family protein [Clostridium brassicae]|uniref:UPF0102 protein OW729_12895 n=1 Tax=Clostridium brassicae TaxID=2999072 RepID=A0ABT4DES0_9CLOT|nr:YraN family protein [Clostridium brassicae]MCY6959509.1 YraN family protein [Clostridium brassicae]